jgi:hypothetical protein
MPSTTGRSAIRLAALLLLALLVSACGRDSASPTAAPATTTTAAPTTTTVLPLDAEELAWLNGGEQPAGLLESPAAPEDNSDL